MSTSDWIIRPVSESDAPQLAAIYAPYVAQTAITFEYTVPSAEEFAQRIRKTLEFYPYIAAERDGVLLGYAYAGTFKGRGGYIRQNQPFYLVFPSNTNPDSFQYYVPSSSDIYPEQ